MRINGMAIMLVAGSVAVGGMLVGCSDNDKRNEAKLEADRVMLRMSEMETQRDGYKKEVAQLQADLKVTQESLKTANDNAARLQQELDQAQANQTSLQSSAADAEQLKKDLAQARQEAADQQARADKLQQELETAQGQVDQLQKQAATPTTQPQELQK